MLSNLLVAALGAALAPSPVNAIWPVPRELETGDKTLFIDQALDITYNGEQLAYTYGYTPEAGADWDSKDIVQSAVSRTLDNIFQKNLVPWMLNERRSEFEPNLRNGTVDPAKDRITSLTITQTEEEDKSPYTSVLEDWDESYIFELAEDGSADISAASSIGVIRALETFSQLFWQHSSGSHHYTKLAPVSIEDEPVYPHRGILFDTSRNWFNVDDILRTIDGMAASKLNKLHLHATDSQSWPLEVPSLPELAAKGAYHPELTYSPEDVQFIQEYAIQRGVQVIVEIGMPSHSGAIWHAYPELVVGYNELPYTWWCVQPPCGQIKMNDSRVDGFLDTLFDDVLPRVAPYSAYFHTGGDELNLNVSRLEENLQTNDTEVLQPILQNFMDKYFDRIRDHGLVPFVWQEMALEYNVTLGDDVIVQAWLGGPAIEELTAMGHKVIDSNSNYWYLDCGRGQWLNFDNGPAWDTFYPFNDWCSPTKNWRLIYSHDPAEGLSEEQAKLVMGGEVTGWSEAIDSANVDTIMWPRASAAGEVLWSGRTDSQGQNRTQIDAAPRLEELRERLVARGVGAAPITQRFCTQGSPEECEQPAP